MHVYDMGLECSRVPVNDRMWPEKCVLMLLHDWQCPQEQECTAMSCQPRCH